MSSTNKTANYELSQFVGTDIPSILSDYNGDMRKIDAGIAEVATSAGSSASAVSALAGRVTTAENNITTLNGALEVTNQRSIQNQTAITAVQGVIPSDASTENLLATVGEVSDVADNVRGVDDRVQAIETVVPSTASSSNKLTSTSDVQNMISGIETETEIDCGTLTLASGYTVKQWVKALNDLIYGVVHGTANADKVVKKIMINGSYMYPTRLSRTTSYSYQTIGAGEYVMHNEAENLYGFVWFNIYADDIENSYAYVVPTASGTTAGDCSTSTAGLPTGKVYLYV